MNREDRPDIGRIKYWPVYDKDDIRFGDVVKYGDEASNYWKEGKIIIEDAVSGQCTLADIDAIEYLEQPYGWNDFDDETGLPIDTDYDRHINDAYKEQMKKDEEAGDGMVKDRMFTVPVADGRAFYVITKVNKTTVDIEWRAFCPDRYSDMTLGFGGKFPKHCIENHIRCANASKKLFSKVGA